MPRWRTLEAATDSLHTDIGSRTSPDGTVPRMPEPYPTERKVSGWQLDTGGEHILAEMGEVGSINVDPKISKPLENR